MDIQETKELQANVQNKVKKQSLYFSLTNQNASPKCTKNVFNNQFEASNVHVRLTNQLCRETQQ